MSWQELWGRSRLAGHSREIGIFSGGLATLVVTSLALGSFALKVNSLTPASGAAIRPETDVDVRFFGLPYSGRITLDGREVASHLSLSSQSLRCYLKGLPEGHHRIQVQLFSPLKTVSAESEFIVDSTPPALTLEAPPKGNPRGPLVSRPHYNLHGQTEPGVTVTLGRGGQGPELQQVPSDDKGKFRLDAELQPGWNQFLVRAKDRAGNVAERPFEVFLDTRQPEAILERVLPDKSGEAARLDGLTLERYKARVRLRAYDDSGWVRSASWSLDGGRAKSLPLKRQGADAQAEFRSEWVLDDMPEGERKLTCTVTDKVGRVTNVTATFLVDSSERLGERPMSRGARGADVEQLQERLAEMGHLEKDACSGVYDEATEAAVRAYQESRGYEATGVLVGETLQSLGPRIFVNLSQCSLVLDRPGRELKRYGVAVGSPSYPTPTGRYKVTYKEKNPTWMPPNSPWAREAKSIPPGPGNPLGTRWIGLDSSCVGIHGTNADWSIGTAASHGCLRMHIPDVEQLYDMVEPGIPVIIYGGWEKNSDIQKYWGH